MRRNVPIGDLDGLLERPLVATLATYLADGAVLLSPVWFEWRDGAFTVTTANDDVKVRHLRRDPRASIVVYEHEPPYRGVEVRGRAELIEGTTQDVDRRIASRYLGQEAGEAFAASIGEAGVLIRLAPGTLRSWDFADEYPVSTR